MTAPGRAPAALLTGQRVLVCDGAMGTMLHAAGAALDRSLPELNLSDPGLVSTIHESYLSAGADIIQANTFGANRLWLGDHGFPDKVDEINRAGVRIARAAQDRCDRDVLVAGSVSPAVTALQQRRQTGSAERTEVIREQIRGAAGRRAWTCSSWRRSATSTSWSRRSAWPPTGATCRSSPRPPSPTTRTPWAARPRARSPPCCPPCRWPCSAPTAPSARSGC